MCPAQGPQRSDADEALTRSPSVSSQALFHLATALPMYRTMKPDAENPGRFPGGHQFLVYSSFLSFLAFEC